MSPGLWTIDSISTAIAKEANVSIFEILDRGQRWEKITSALGFVGSLVGAGFAVSELAGWLPQMFLPFGIGLLATGIISFALAASSYQYRIKRDKSDAVNALQERARAEPDEPQLAWDVARIKLESYLDRNLKQVSSIYWLTLAVMLFGMALIAVGVYRAISVPTALQAAGLAALAGVVVQIIGGTILLIYRSTMAQAKDYVIVLERINAVGMSINILEGVEDSTGMKNEAKVQLSKNLLGMYAMDQRPNTKEAEG